MEKIITKDTHIIPSVDLRIIYAPAAEREPLAATDTFEINTSSAFRLVFSCHVLSCRACVGGGAAACLPSIWDLAVAAAVIVVGALNHAAAVKLCWVLGEMACSVLALALPCCFVRVKFFVRLTFDTMRHSQPCPGAFCLELAFFHVVFPTSGATVSRTFLR